mgnify:FL=1
MDRQLLREYNKVLLKDRFVVVPWLTNTRTNAVMRMALAATGNEKQNDEWRRQIPEETKKWFGVFSGYNMCVLEGMTGMEWVPADIDNNPSSDDSIGVYYNCADTDYVCEKVCWCSTGLIKQQTSLRVVVPSGHALVVYHSPCLNFYRPREETRHTFFGLKYKNIFFGPYDISPIDIDDNAMVDAILNLTREDEGEEDMMRCSTCMLKMKDLLFIYLDAIGIDEAGAWEL